MLFNMNFFHQIEFDILTASNYLKNLDQRTSLHDIASSHTAIVAKGFWGKRNLCLKFYNRHLTWLSGSSHTPETVSLHVMNSL